MCEFIKKDPKSYNRIELVVDRQDDFIYSEKLLLEKCDVFYTMIPFYCAHKDREHFFYEIPREIIDYIALLSVLISRKSMSGV